MIHTLRTWPDPFAAVVSGHKTHEIRKNDRGYAVGDVLYLHEWDPASELYTGKSYAVEVTFMTAVGEWDIPAGLCVMSIRRAS